MKDFKEMFEKFYVFTLTFIVTVIALFWFGTDKDIVNLIIGAIIGLMTAPVVLPRDKV